MPREHDLEHTLEVALVILVIIVIALCLTGCPSVPRWTPPPAVTPAADLHARQAAATLSVDGDPLARALAAYLGPAVEPPDDTPLLMLALRSDAEARWAAELEWRQGGGAINPNPAPAAGTTGGWGFLRWLTKWCVGWTAVIVGAVALFFVLGGVKGALALRAVLARGKAAWGALVAVTGNVDRARAILPADANEALVDELKLVTPEVKELVAEARKEAGTKPP